MGKNARWALAVSLAAGVLDPRTGLAHEHGSSEFELFLSAEAMHASRNVQRGEDDSWFNADMIFALTRNRFRVLGEYLVTAEEHDLERFQVGFEIVPDTMFWVGRFHQPSSAWNSEHHHGRYLQTAITRPSIERWEDEHGIIPQHVVGALIESRRALGPSGGLQLAMGLGAAPSIENHELDPTQILGNSLSGHRLSATARVAWLPDYAGPSSMGLLYGHHEITVRGHDDLLALRVPQVNLELQGAYLDWTRDPWRAIATLYYVYLDMRGTDRNEHFTALYAQLERRLPWQLSAYGRVETSSNMQRSRVVTLFDDHDGDFDMAVRRNALGLRWDFARRQALSVELSRAASLDQHSDEVRLQWSAAIP